MAASTEFPFFIRFFIRFPSGALLCVCCKNLALVTEECLRHTMFSGITILVFQTHDLWSVCEPSPAAAMSGLTGSCLEESP